MNELCEVRLNGRALFGAGQGSATVIFRSLNGENFSPERRRPYDTRSHDEYLAWMGKSLSVSKWEGDLTLHTPAGDVLLKHTFPKTKINARELIAA